MVDIPRTVRYLERCRRVFDREVGSVGGRNRLERLLRCRFDRIVVGAPRGMDHVIRVIVSVSAFWTLLGAVTVAMLNSAKLLVLSSARKTERRLDPAPAVAECIRLATWPPPRVETVRTAA